MKPDKSTYFFFYNNLSSGTFQSYLATFDLFQNQLSGNLLRKFKNSNGWQKLWVVFTNFCMFFYKSHQVMDCTGVCGCGKPSGFDRAIAKRETWTSVTGAISKRSECTGHGYRTFTATGTWSRARSQSALLSIERRLLVSWNFQQSQYTSSRQTIDIPTAQKLWC